MCLFCLFVGGGIQVLATARPDAPSRREAEVVLPEEAEALRPLQKPSDDTVPQRVAEDKGKGEQAAWIRRYMDQQEEDSEEDEFEQEDEDDWEVGCDYVFLRYSFLIGFFAAV
jgi:hypothetical protein